MSLLAQVLAPPVFGAEIYDAGQTLSLPTQEAALVAAAGASRQRDFTLGRSAARQALTAAGMADAVLPRADNGAPLWPAGFVGSITHTKGYAAALAARTDAVRGLGIDAERIGGVTETLAPRLFCEPETDWLAAVPAALHPLAITLLFSAKEAAFKASNPPAGAALHFRAVHIEVQGTLQPAGTFRVRRAGLADAFGRFANDGDLLLAAVIL